MGKYISVLFAIVCLASWGTLSPFCAKAQLPTVQSTGVDSGACQLDVRPIGFVYFRGLHSRGYVASDSAMHQEHVALDIQHRGEACAYVVEVESVAGGAPRMASQQDMLDYRIMSDRPQGNGMGDSVELSGHFRAGDGSSTANFFIEVPTEQHVRAGRYQDEIIVSLYDDTSGAMQLIASRSFYVLTQVPASVSASFGADANANLKATSIEFGQLRQNKTRSVDFAVDANTPYDVSFESENGGTLRHFASEAKIAYALKLDGARISPIALESGDAIIRGATSSIHGLDIEIVDDLGRAVAGRYEDHLTVVITAE